MTMGTEEAKNLLKVAIPIVQERFFDQGETFTCFGLEVQPEIILMAGELPNAALAPLEEGMGVEVSTGLLGISNNIAINFVLGHELSHGFSEQLLGKIGLQGISGPATEVVADLGAAFLLTQAGISWQELIHTLEGWQTHKIFDEHQSGDHPPGASRLRYVKNLRMLLFSGLSFEEACKLILTSL